MFIDFSFVRAAMELIPHEQVLYFVFSTDCASWESSPPSTPIHSHWRIL